MKEPRHILLLGAGFSRNWGGWTADELTGDLLGRLQDKPDLARALRDSESFEDFLSRLQAETIPSEPKPSGLKIFESAIKEAFRAMNEVYASERFDFGWGIHGPRSIMNFLQRFDQVFTLNQDLLLEMAYKPCEGCTPEWSVDLRSGDGWRWPIFPGIDMPVDKWPTTPGGWLDYVTTPVENERLRDKLPHGQPVFKLHGSVNWWKNDDSEDLLVMGGNKTELIKKEPLLNYYFEEFKESLLLGDTRLMVIGYSFQDEHINELLIGASRRAKLKTFIVDLKGFKVLNACTKTGSNNGGALKRDPAGKLAALNLIGSSQRTLREIFTVDDLERSKLERFFV